MQQIRRYNCLYKKGYNETDGNGFINDMHGRPAVPAVVLRTDCEFIILQSSDPGIAGDASWTNVRNGQTYTNVIACANTCMFGGTAIAGQTVYIDPSSIRYGARYVPPGCAQCDAISPSPPATIVDIKRFGLAPCE
jgi:hypothetical protein